MVFFTFTVSESAVLGIACLAHSTEVLASLAATGLLFASLTDLRVRVRAPLNHPLWTGIPDPLVGRELSVDAALVYGDSLGRVANALSLVAIVAFFRLCAPRHLPTPLQVHPGRAVHATMNLYLDMLNIFLCFLSLFDGEPQ